MTTPTDKQIKAFLLEKVTAIKKEGKEIELNWVYRAPVGIVDGVVVIASGLKPPNHIWTLDKQFLRKEFFQNRDGEIYPYTLEDIGNLFRVRVTLNDY